MAQLIVAGNAAAAQVLTGSTFSAGALTGAVGTMANNGAVTITPSASAQTIAAGYHNGSGTVPAVTFTAANVLAGTTIAGTAGTMVNRGAVNINPSTVAQTILAGYHNGSGTVAGDANLVASNIRTGLSIFGISGTLTPLTTEKKTARGSAASSSAFVGFTDYASSAINLPTLTVTGLNFTPSLIFIWSKTSANTNGHNLTLYDSTASVWNYVSTTNVVITLTGSTPSISGIKTGANWSVTSGGFVMPVRDASTTQYWFAVE